MVLMMSRPTRRKGSSKLYFRRKVPKHLLAAVRGKTVTFRLSPATPSPGATASLVTGTFGAEIKVSLRTSEPAIAKRRHAEVAVQLESFYESLAQPPSPLSNKDVQWLAGLLYDGFAQGGEDEPGDAAVWANVAAVNDDAANGALLSIGDAGQRAERTARLDRRFGTMVDALLRGQGIITDIGSRVRLLEAVGDALSQAARKLHRNASGDYRPDPDGNRFPSAPTDRLRKKPAGVVPSTDAPASFWSVYERWKRETTPAASTLITFKGHLKRAEKFFGHADMSLLTRPQVVAWKDALLAEGLKTVRSGQLTTLKAMYSYAVANSIVEHNPTLGVKVLQKPPSEAPRRAYSAAEVQRILSLANEDPRQYIRWLPWLMALTGARITEPAQLWADCIRNTEHGWVIDLRPCPQGGSFKNRKPRTVPLHSALVASGFLEFVETRRGAPLFYKPRKAWDREARHPSKSVANKVAVWVREQGFDDRRLGPTHSFRHWFRTEAQRMGNDITLIDAVTGHAPRTVGDGYLHPEPETLRPVVESIKVPSELIVRTLPRGTPIRD